MEMVNARVDAATKRAAEGVFAASGRTASEVVRSLYQHVAATNSLPDFVSDPGGSRAARRAATLAALRGAVGRSDIGRSTTAGLSDDEALYLETDRRHA